jgi:hypothetical protein
VVDIGRAWVGVYDFRVGVRGLVDGLGEVAGGGFGARADVVRLADEVGRGGQEVGLDDIVDMDEVAGLRAVAVDGDRLVVPGLLEEDGNDRRRSTGVAL